MARKNTGGKSFRVDVALPPDLYAAVEKQMKRKKIDRISEAVRIALAEWVKKPALGEGMQPGRPRSKE